jgi:ATPase subunit of ABC transporter with duplicated ATPase domains
LAAIFPESSEIVGAYALALSNRISGTQSSTKEKIKKRNANDILKIERLYNKHKDNAAITTSLACIRRDKIYTALKGKKAQEVSRYMDFLTEAHQQHSEEGGIQSCYLVAYYLIHFEYVYQVPTDEELSMFHKAAVKFDEYEELRGYYARLLFLREQHFLEN